MLYNVSGITVAGSEVDGVAAVAQPFEIHAVFDATPQAPSPVNSYAVISVTGRVGQ
ncbi:MAG: hypothetical protein SFX72_13985 [Isosphaeraceae bacterium]|nr:hypothetical protein [Isosphaeraceae bacterium]